MGVERKEPWVIGSQVKVLGIINPETLVGHLNFLILAALSKQQRKDNAKATGKPYYPFP